MKNIIFILFILTLTKFVSGQQMGIEIEGNINFDNSLFTISEAGEDFPSSIETESSVFISIVSSNYFDKKDNPNGKWNVSIHKEDFNWDTNLLLEIRRTGNGTKQSKNGNVNIHDGRNYQEITNTTSYFFRGKSEITDIPIKLKLSIL